MNGSGQDAGGNLKDRILAAAVQLVEQGGSDALTTRAVAAMAGTQGPTIYRLFGDKHGLVEAVAEYTFHHYIADKEKRSPGDDPVLDLRQGWDAHVAFGLANPAIYLIMFSARPDRVLRAATAGYEVLRKLVRRVAQTGQLRVSEEHAVELIHAVGTGTVLSLIRKAPADREGLADMAREAVFAAILQDRPIGQQSGATGAASTLRASLDDVAILSPGERLLIGELLTRIAQQS